MTDQVRVLDTSSLIRVKVLVRVDKQWDLFQQLQTLVDSGGLAMPRQVIREMGDLAHPDAPGVWARGMQDRLKHPLDADPRHVQRVMKIAPNLVEANQRKDVADPYVVGLALELMDQGLSVEVVTDDVIDHLPAKIALATACDRLSIAHITCENFVRAIGF